MAGKSDLVVAPPRWSSAFFGIAEQELEQHLEPLPERLSAFAESFQGQVSALSGTGLAQALRDYEEFFTPLQQGTVYAEARLAADSADEGARKLLDRCEELWEMAATKAEFFEREFGELPEKAAGELLACPVLAQYRNHLRQVRAAAANSPSAEVATVLAQLDPVAGWERHARRLLDRVTVVDDGARLALGAALPVLYQADRGRRNQRCAAISAALAPEADLRASALTELTRARLARQRLCGQAGWLSEENANNQLTGDEVSALLDAVGARRELVHRYYTAKAALLGHPLTDADRYAPVSASADELTWPEAVEVVLGAFAALGPAVSAAATDLIERGAVDAAPGKGKRRGALTFSAPGGHSCVLLTFTGTQRDVLTLAHELGHAVHAALSGRLGVLSFSPPTVLAETVALFAEAITMRHWLHQAGAAARPGLLARWLEDQLVTAFRQLSVHEFESTVHRAVAASEPPDADALGDLWLSAQGALYGPAVSLTPGYRLWWSYLDNLYFAPGTRYAYAFGQLAATSLLARSEERDFGARFEALLRAGGGGSPADLLGPLGFRPAEPDSWQSGLAALEAQVGEFAVTVS
ncbi:M3 family metallopeptidase [Amycolatopsis sp. NPDC026612]|uniref:M3 family metallopeptidase n=1 Tax=Amycolatopsis sp. NPDC026612 TaxID=3155466 RepID=UPI0033C88DB8